MNIKKILVSQPKPITEKSPYYDIAKKYDLQIDFKPFIRVEPISLREFRAQKINIQDYVSVIFTAKTAIDHYFSLCKELRLPVSKSIKYFCLSEAVALYLQKYIVYRRRKIFFSKLAKLNDLLGHICKYNNENYLIPVSNIHRNSLFNLLDEKKIKYKTVTMYRTVNIDFRCDEKFDYDLLLFFSPAGIDSLLKNFPNFEQKNILIGTFGQTTAEAVEKAGLRIDISAPKPKIPSMVVALENFLNEINR
ncbi:MAG: uroporphyrinogen-III synthase [Bacteroidales bacterium OttesenSCG-928-I14]|nr:uroporphyrinogen-III synthase [Bacteroidales bacterium OttesenSCG-928-I14]